jgi:hypothetical protein
VDLQSGDEVLWLHLGRRDVYKSGSKSATIGVFGAQSGVKADTKGVLQHAVSLTSYLGGRDGTLRLETRFQKVAGVGWDSSCGEEFGWPRWSCSIPCWGSGQG